MASSSTENQHFCDQCNLRVFGTSAWQQHLESKGHRRKESQEDNFNLNGEDMFLDDESPTMKLLSKFRGILLVGVEHIVEDRTNDEIKCMMCRVILKTTTLADHLKSYGHHKLYLERLYPQIFRDIQLKSQKKGDVAYLVQKECEKLVRQYGRQKVRIYEKGYAERRRKMIEEQRASLESVNGPVSGNAFPSSSASAEEFEELPKNERVTQVLLNSTLESFPKGQSAYVNEVIKHISGPVIGLEFVAEYTDRNGEYEPGYLCTTCESCLNSAQLVNHVMTDKHRLKYLDRNYKDYYKIVNFSAFTDERRKELLLKYSQEIEAKRGRGEITLRLIVPPNSEFLFRYHKRLRGNDSDSPKNGPSSSKDTLLNEPFLESYGPWTEDRPSSSAHGPSPGSTMKTQLIPFGPFRPSKFVPISPLSSQPVVPKIQTFLVSDPYSRDSIIPPSQRVSASIQPRKPTFVYSEKEENARKLMEFEKSLPPWIEKNLDSGWYSERAFSVDCYFQRVADLNLDYLSIRCPQARANIYDDWSPYLMRRLQDQFNFELDHLAWLQSQIIRWRMPLYQPLQPADLRPLEEEVENAVLDILTYRTLKPFKIGKNRSVIEYESKIETKNSEKEKEVEIFDYEHSLGEPVPKKVKLSSRLVPSITSQKIQRSFSPQFKREWVEKIHTQQIQNTNAVPVREARTSAENVMLTICDQILKTAKNNCTNNSVFNLLLNYENAKNILYNLATKQPKRLHQLVAYVRNPEADIDCLKEYEKIFDDFSQM